MILGMGGWALGGLGAHELLAGTLPSGALETERLEVLSGKQPLIKRSYRPPNYESPRDYLDGTLTPNDRFFVRWHLSNIPVVSEPASWRLTVGGEAAGQSFELGLAELQRGFEPVELVAVCQCAGNQRGLAEPHAPGVQWGAGAVGNARWRGVRLRDLLARARLKPEALEIAFDAGDGPALPQTPDFTKSIPVWKALDEDTLVAYEMNGAPLPHWNGFPARLVVPGWAGTYWVKQLTAITVRSTPLASFWMSTAYRIPRGKYPQLARFGSQESDTSVPIMEIDVNSVITHPVESSRVRVGSPVTIRGIAWDSGTGIRTVEVSSDGGQKWQSARLGPSLGRYSFRSWQYTLTPRSRGRLSLITRATSMAGMTQPATWTPNPAGYHSNALQAFELMVG